MKAFWVIEEKNKYAPNDGKEFYIVQGIINEERLKNHASSPGPAYDTAAEAWTSIEHRVKNRGYVYAPLPDQFHEFVEKPGPRACWLKR